LVKTKDYAYWRHSNRSIRQEEATLAWRKTLAFGSLSFIVTVMAVAMNTLARLHFTILQTSAYAHKFGFDLGYFIPLIVLATLSGIVSFWQYRHFQDVNESLPVQNRKQGGILALPVVLLFPVTFFWLVILMSILIDLALNGKNILKKR
jgi:magnesium-transporting ATPase (P-type)